LETRRGSTQERIPESYPLSFPIFPHSSELRKFQILRTPGARAQSRKRPQDFMENF
jgi:hypothetical protein